MIELSVNLALRTSLIPTLASNAGSVPNSPTRTQTELHVYPMTPFKVRVVIALRCTMIDLINFVLRVILCLFAVIALLSDLSRWKSTSKWLTKRECSFCQTSNLLTKIDLIIIN
jgi:hypothetical protein